MSAIWLGLAILYSRQCVADYGDSSTLVASANNQFSLNIFAKVKGDNVILSPFSISTVLSMLLNGANGDTATEMKTALQYASLSQDEINKGYVKILPALNGGNNYTLSTANAVFVNQSFKVLDSFNQVLVQDYQSQSYQLTDVSQINSFVSQKTNGKIPSLLDTLPDDTQIVLVNAIYFYGMWKTQFNKSDSSVGPFKNEDGTLTSTTLMHLTNKFQYTQSDELQSQVLVLPYVGETVKLIVILPNDPTKNLQSTESLLTPDNILSTAQNGTEQKVIVTLPRFKIESSFDLGDALMQLGMKLAFTDDADFSGVSDTTRIKVSQVVQKAIIEVNEEGTVAAAATAVVGVTAAVGIEPIIFEANRPFFFALYHQPTNSVLFIGKYVKASSA